MRRASVGLGERRPVDRCKDRQSTKPRFDPGGFKMMELGSEQRSRVPAAWVIPEACA